MAGGDDARETRVFMRAPDQPTRGAGAIVNGFA